MKIHLIRHGATVGNLRGAYIGTTDEPLSPQGRESLMPLSQEPQPIYVSQLQRSQESARLLFPQGEQIIVPDLNEMNFGIFEGKNYQDLVQDKDYRHWVEGGCLGICPQGEGRVAFQQRCVQGFTSTLQKHSQDMAIFVIHGGSIMALCSHFCPNSDFYQWHIPCGASLSFRWTGSHLEVEK